MDFMICAHGNPEEEEFIPYIKDYVDGVELQNYGLTGSKSIAAWNEKLTQHKSIAKKLPGRLALFSARTFFWYGLYLSGSSGKRSCKETA